MKITYQFVLFNTPEHTVERTLLWLSTAATNYREINPDFKLQVSIGDCSPSELIPATAWEAWRRTFAEIFELRYEFFDENLGHGGAQNRLASQAWGAFIIFANPDILVSPDIFEILVESFSAAPDLAALDAKQIPFEHPKDYDPVSGATDWCSGAFLMVDRAAFDAVGGFDHRTFFMHGDDVDLSWRLKLAGYRIMHQPAAVVNHAKLLSEEGFISTTDTERRYSALAALLLPYKWSRNDIVTQARHWLLQSQDEFHQLAVKQFDHMAEVSELPARLDRNHKVAVFKSGNYATHRWS